ncbi:MAG: hypothetical protein HDS72_06000 [Bacteroidales bacterium]|nr:hypothetical protein [Bacteroidales bacterium]
MVKDFFRSRTGVLWLGMFASLLYFVIVWSLGSTFRGMSNWVLYPINLMAAGVLTLPYMLSRRVWVQIVVMVAVQLLLIANLMYYRTYFTAIPLGSYALVGNVAEFTASIRDSLRALDFGFPLITILTAWRALQAPAKPCGARTWAVRSADLGRAGRRHRGLCAGGLRGRGLQGRLHDGSRTHFAVRIQQPNRCAGLHRCR